jgi:hypothetical protein
MAKVPALVHLYNKLPERYTLSNKKDGHTDVIAYLTSGSSKYSTTRHPQHRHLSCMNIITTNQKLLVVQRLPACGSVSCNEGSEPELVLERARYSSCTIVKMLIENVQIQWRHDIQVFLKDCPCSSMHIR